MISKEEMQRKDEELLKWERQEAFNSNGGATKKRRGHPTNLTPKRKKRKRK